MDAHTMVRCRAILTVSGSATPVLVATVGARQYVRISLDQRDALCRLLTDAVNNNIGPDEVFERARNKLRAREPLVFADDAVDAERGVMRTERHEPSWAGHRAAWVDTRCASIFTVMYDFGSYDTMPGDGELETLRGAVRTMAVAAGIEDPVKTRSGTESLWETR